MMKDIYEKKPIGNIIFVVDWTMSLQNPYVEALTPNVTVFEDGTCRKVIKVKWGHKGIALTPQD